jgi:hypothetical protein
MGFSRAESSLQRGARHFAGRYAQDRVLPLCTRPFDAGRSLGLTIVALPATVVSIVEAFGVFRAALAIVLLRLAMRFI